MISKIFILAAFLFLTAAAQAQYNVEPYYQANAFVTGRILPFAVTNVNGEPVEIHSITKPSPCSVMIDPYRSNVLLLHCPVSATIQLDLFVKESQKLVKLSLAGLVVKKVSISTLPDPVIVPDPIPDSIGQTKFNVNCKSCHNVSLLPKNTTPASLTGKFNTVSAMSKFKGFFTASELTALSNYINGGL